MAAMKIWATVRKKQKIVKQTVEDFEFNGQWSDELLQEALNDCCKTLDVARPVLLDKHFSELTKYSRTRFSQSEFVEPIDFDAFEIEVYDPA